MADPLSPAELEHARWLAANRPDVTSSVVARLLATVDDLAAQRERFADTLIDMRRKGVIILDRAKWQRYAPEDDDGRWVAYVPFASMLPDEIDAYYAAHPELMERDHAIARRLAAELEWK